MQEWHSLLSKCMKDGTPRRSPGVSTHALFDVQFRVWMGAATFPAFTSKQLYFGQVKAELAAFLHGETTLDGFHKWGCKIWDANAANHRSGEIGRVYGAQWRQWPREGMSAPLDQLQALVDGIKAEPFSRRHILQSYNPGATSACLPACHMSAQFYVVGNMLNCTVTMRSCDLFLGLPFDVASYALLCNLVAKELKAGLVPGNLTFNICDAHIYKNHQQAVRDVLERDIHKAPHLVLSPESSLFDFEPKHAELDHYVHSGPLSAPMNVHEEPNNVS